MNCRCAGIVLYNPELKRLRANISAIKNQVNIIILIDNNSANSDAIIGEYGQTEKFVIVRNGNNKGIATALNQICYKALEMGFDWVLLLDQDSICSPNIISTYEKYVLEESVALITPYIIDINKMSLEDFLDLDMPEFSFVKWAITSGSLIKLSIWETIGKFDDDLFIDAVDFDYSIRLVINEYKQIRVNSEFLLQEVGHAEPTWIIRPHKDNAGKWTIKRYYRTNHSLIRQYYMTRNHVILARRYQKYKPKLKGIMFAIIMTVPKIFVEKNKLEVLKTLVRGFYDGLKCDIIIYERLV